MEGYDALRQRAAWMDLSGRGHILAHGDDRKRLLHAMTTNHVQELEPGLGCYAFFLNDRGRIIADVNILARPEFLILDVEPETRQLVYEHLDKYIIADDVTLEDRTDRTAVLGLEGPNSDEILRKVGVPLPETPNSQAEWEEAVVARLSFTGGPGYRIFSPVEKKQTLIDQLESAGAMRVDLDTARVLRLELGRPRYGEEITDRYLAQETGIERAMHFSKGCYLGQEIVERVRSRGQVRRHLTRLEIAAEHPPQAGTKLTADGDPAAEIVSAVYSPGLGKTIALAYVRTESARPGAVLEGADGPAVVTGPPA